MAATDKIDHLELMKEVVSILRGENRGWTGDRIYNAEFFLHCLAHDLPEASANLASDLDANAGDYSELLGISPDRVRWCANRLRDRLLPI